MSIFDSYLHINRKQLPAVAFGFIFCLLTAKSFAAPVITDDWAQIKENATQFVAPEINQRLWWIKKPGSNSSAKVVIAHYFPTFPLSIDNRPTSEDYYSKNFLSPEGEKGKFQRSGGYLRERPLPVPVWEKNNYMKTNLAIEILRAESIGIDAFGIDLLSINSGKGWAVATDLLDTANHISKKFKVVPEPDMVALKSATVEDLATALVDFSKSPSSYHTPNGELLVIPFSAESRTAEFWQNLIALMKTKGAPIALFPDLVDASKAVNFTKFSAGITFWGGRNPQSAASQLITGKKFLSLMGGSNTVMMPVAAQDFRPKSSMTWEASNTDTYRAQWQSAIESKAGYVHLLTWNDYSESSEISPSTGIQFLLYDLAAYYIDWLKQGTPPQITKDTIFYSYRRQIFDPHAADRGNAIRIVGGGAITNNIEMLALLKSPAEIRIEINGKSVDAKAHPGMNILLVPAQPGTPTFRITRNGQNVTSVKGAFSILSNPGRQDALYVGGGSNRNAISYLDSSQLSGHSNN